MKKNDAHSRPLSTLGQRYLIKTEVWRGSQKRGTSPQSQKMIKKVDFDCMRLLNREKVVVTLERYARDARICVRQQCLEPPIEEVGGFVRENEISPLVVVKRPLLHLIVLRESEGHFRNRGVQSAAYADKIATCTDQGAQQ